MFIILVTGARELRDQAKAESLAWSLLEEAWIQHGRTNIKVIHGDAEGIDTIFRTICEEHGIAHEPWPAHLFPTPLIRNKFMVNLVAELQRQGDEAVCWAFARRWASGTGHCAREARRRGLNVIDFGVSTEDPKDPF